MDTLRRTTTIDGVSAAAPPRRAFTLLELVLVLMILAVAAAVAAPRYGASLARYRVESAAQRVAADLALAQALARASSAGRRVDFDIDADEYRIVRSGDGSVIRTVRLSEEPYRARLEAADFGGLSRAGFDGYGTPVAAGTVIVVVGDRRRAVSMDAQTGAVSVAPN